MAYTTFTRADLRAKLQVRFENVPFWDDEDANRSLNRTFRVWNCLTGYWRTPLALPTVPNDPLLPIPGTLVQQTTVSWNGLPLVGVGLDELQLMAPDWWYARGTPRVWSPVGLNLVAFYPTSATAQVVEIDGVRDTPVMTTDASTADIGPEELDTLLGYALHDAAMKAGASVVQRTKKYHVAFVKAAGERNGLLKATRWYRRVVGQTPYSWPQHQPAAVVGVPNVEVP